MSEVSSSYHRNRPRIESAIDVSPCLLTIAKDDQCGISPLRGGNGRKNCAIPTHYHPPTSNHRDWRLGLGSALELGIWSLGFDTLHTHGDSSPTSKSTHRVPTYGQNEVTMKYMLMMHASGARVEGRRDWHVAAGGYPGAHRVHGNGSRKSSISPASWWRPKGWRGRRKPGSSTGDSERRAGSHLTVRLPSPRSSWRATGSSTWTAPPRRTRSRHGHRRARPWRNAYQYSDRGARGDERTAFEM